MSTATLLNKYVWLVTTVYNRGPISLTELCSRWERYFGRDDELTERTFHRYTDAVEELFDIDIVYNRMQRGYVINNRDGIDHMTMRKWLIQTFSVNNILRDNHELKNRILLEDVPSGQQYLTPIIEAMRESVTLLLTYHSFHRNEPSTFEVEPWCVKLFQQRWYMLGKSVGYDKPRIYSFDRIKSLELTGHIFKLPPKFDASKYFADYYGIVTGDDDFDVEPVALKVDAGQSNYLRTLPLHHSQVEVERSEMFSIFEYRLCPTFDFRQKLLSMGGSIEVMAPQELIYRMRDEGEAIADKHQMPEMSNYEFKVYK